MKNRVNKSTTQVLHIRTPASSEEAPPLEYSLEFLGKEVGNHTKMLNMVIERKLIFSDQFKAVKKQCDIAAGKKHSVVIYGLPERMINERRKRDQDMRSRSLNLMRLVGISELIRKRRVLRLGRWKDSRTDDGRKPRQTLIEFSNPRHRDRFLENSGQIKMETEWKVLVVPDNRTLRNAMLEVSSIHRYHEQIIAW